MKYAILKAESDWDLQTEVREYLEMGYKPAGGVSFIRYKHFEHHYEKWTQAVYRKD